MKYNFNDIEAKWQQYWAEHQTFQAKNQSEKPKYYILDMFPYPSGAGLHVGHPLGYIASDIYARYKRHKGFNVLHPQGYDSFGLPAEQYAIQTGQHPAITTETNIATYRRQLDQIGFSFDWSREVRTSNPEYYKWTQWIFIQLFESWFNLDSGKAESIDSLIAVFSAEGNATVNAVCDDNIEPFTAEAWNSFSSEQKQDVLLQYRLTYLAETEVNWCPALGTVLANDEIVNGVSERGGHPVVRKKMTQWSMRISAYAERLLQGLNDIDWTDSLKESQRNWIGKSVGASVTFNVKDHNESIEVFTTRPDTIFGVSFMTLAPEHELVSQITTAEQKEAVEAYIEKTAKRSERERMADVKTISGVFTGAYAEHPFSKEPVPIWIGDYVLASYGTGAVMAVPCGDQRDYDFAKHFDIAIPNIFEGVDISEEAFAEKGNTKLTNSYFLNGLSYKEATPKAIEALEAIGQGEGKTNYRLRDAVFSRQRYWGEPFPVYYVNGKPQMIATEHLPIRLPEVEKYLPTETGEPPLGRADVWAWCTETHTVVSNEKINHTTVFPLELNTMPGWAGSSWYFFRYMEEASKRGDAFASEDALNYWGSVDLYIGGSEHATGHLLYSRFWVKFLKDRGFVNIEEPFKKLINQGMILGTSAFVYRVDFSHHTSTTSKESKEPSLSKSLYVSYDSVKKFEDLYNFILSSKISAEDKKTFGMGNGFNKGLASVIEDTVFFDILNDEQKETVIAFQELYKIIEKDIYNQNFGVVVEGLKFSPIHVKVQYVNASDELDIEGLKTDGEFGEDFKDAEFILEDGVYKVGREVEKMSKSKYNVVNPDQICAEYGADSLRLYEMFLGPLEQAKPWNTAGITGVHGFLKKLWKLYIDEDGLVVTDAEPTKDNLKTLHKTIKKVQEDIENFSFNTSVSTFMIAVNEFNAQKCESKAVLEPFLILLSPYAPHIAEELWSQLGNSASISEAPFPVFDASHLVESSKVYPISFNGKMRFTLELSLDLTKDELEEIVMSHEKTQEQLQGRTPKKVIVVPGKIINIVG
ncbi:leucine--tRNA ligase [Formosa algae]|uniref:Leucine--tRNA ligase n=1 Tax=Formosa algae TaxID=225843 RepID=A0A9X1C8H9_9FLAO|nr:class I tRNA ligase family protein [Formosa algae]MBP1839311.1 leucyl-tRNA synthetase [Formosa algae]MDQ0334088.1 leucyl-tRNA synthetase [Formosa algae]OEI79414.1 leucine--tRNA ligase [Formosa algae]